MSVPVVLVFTAELVSMKQTVSVASAKVTSGAQPVNTVRTLCDRFAVPHNMVARFLSNPWQMFLHSYV